MGIYYYTFFKNISIVKPSKPPENVICLLQMSDGRISESLDRLTAVAYSKTVQSTSFYTIISPAHRLIDCACRTLLSRSFFILIRLSPI